MAQIYKTNKGNYLAVDDIYPAGWLATATKEEGLKFVGSLSLPVHQFSEKKIVEKVECVVASTHLTSEQYLKAIEVEESRVRNHMKDRKGRLEVKTLEYMITCLDEMKKSVS